MSRFEKSSIILKRLAEQERGKRNSKRDTELRRGLAASSVERKKRRPNVVTAPPTKTPRYKHDSEAYKRNKVKNSVITGIIKSGGLVDGVKIR